MGEETTSPMMGPQCDEAEVFLPAVSKLNNALLASFRMSSDGPEAEQEHPLARCLSLQLHLAPMASRQSCRTSGFARRPDRPHRIAGSGFGCRRRSKCHVVADRGRGWFLWYLTHELCSVSSL